MRIIYKPTVTLVSKSQLWIGEEIDKFTGDDKAEHGESWLEDNIGSLDAIPEFAGRVCYHSFQKRRPGGNQKYIEHILKEGHGSVLEHSYVTFLITGVSRSLTHELIRHRAGTAFSELSQRFYEPDSDAIGFVMPPLAIGNSQLETEMKASFRAAADRYLTLSSLCIPVASKYVANSQHYKTPQKHGTMTVKRAREAARAVLPNATETHIVMSGNLRAWRNVIEQRGSLMADAEIRRLAACLAENLCKHAPNVFQDTNFTERLSDELYGPFDHPQVDTIYRKV